MGTRDSTINFIDRWLGPEPTDAKIPDLTVCIEITSKRSEIVVELANIVKDHLIGDRTLKLWTRLPNCARLVKNKLPTSKRIRSGDLGEIIATEYAVAKTTFTIPIKRLRWKDDRNTSMRGDDAIGYQQVGARIRVLKVEF